MTAENSATIFLESGHYNTAHWFLPMPKFVPVNKDFFKTWSHDMAYVLGFFTADGCLTINPRGAHYIDFVSIDFDVIQKIKVAMKSGHKIAHKKRHENWKEIYRIQIGRKKMFNDLARLGYKVDKTHDIKLPAVPDEFFIDFLRGFFDGDGCISYGSYNYRGRRSKKFHILIRFVCFNKGFLEDLSFAIGRLCGTSGKTIFYHSRSYALAYSTLDSIKIIKQFYKNPSGIWMDRKYKSCQKALQQYYKLRK